MWVRALDWEDPLKKTMATRSSILAWRIPWTEQPTWLHSIGLQRVTEHTMIADLQCCISFRCTAKWISTYSASGSADPGDHRVASMEPVSMPPLKQLPEITECGTLPFSYDLLVTEKEKSLKEIGYWVFREWILNVPKNFIDGKNWETLAWMNGKTASNCEHFDDRIIMSLG